MIRRRDDKADALVKVYFSFFTLARILELAPRVTKETFKSITDLPEDMGSIAGWVEEFKVNIPSLINRYCPWISQIPLQPLMKGKC